MERLQRKFNPVVVIIGVVILILVIISIVVVTRGTLRVGPNAAGTYSVDLADGVNVGFPCKAHATPSVHDNKGVTVTSATCQAPSGSKATNDNLLFTAVYEDYANDRAAQLTDYNYCTSRSTQPGVGQDANTHITTTQKLISDNKTYTACILTNTQGLAYEARAVTMNGSSNLLLQIDAPYPTSTSALQNDLHEFVGNASIQ